MNDQGPRKDTQQMIGAHLDVADPHAEHMNTWSSQILGEAQASAPLFQAWLIGNLRVGHSGGSMAL